MKLSELIRDLELLAKYNHKDANVYVSYSCGPDICDYDSSDSLEVTLDENRDLRIRCFI